jgi:DNA-binding GntR family transcriptional regulator
MNGGRTPADRSGMRLGAWVYDHLKSQLLDGRYAPGDRLSVEDMRKAFGVSKQPVMEAMRRLSSDGFVTITPQVGCEVSRYQTREVEDFFRLFGGFEAAIAEVAAERRTPAQLTQLVEVHEQIGRARGERDPAVRAHVYRVLNRQFHGVIHAMAQSQIMAETSLRMWDLSDFLINSTPDALSMDIGLEARHDDHERIRAALAAADGPTARREMERHIVTTVRASR